MLVDVQGGQRRNIDFELVLRRNSLRRLRIQTVDAFDDQNVIGAHGNRRVLIELRNEIAINAFRHKRSERRG